MPGSNEEDENKISQRGCNHRSTQMNTDQEKSTEGFRGRGFAVDVGVGR
jgi:hypothetical protein